MEKFISRSEVDTHRLAEKIAESIKRGLPAGRQSKIIALYGNLGSGKTTFVQGLAKALRIRQRIISPTFVIIRPHKLKTNKTFYHIDLYRLGKADPNNLGLKEIFLEKDAIVAIEWAEKIEKLLPKDTLKIKFKTLSENEREVTIENE